MKRIIILLLFHSLMITAFAQQGLHINDALNGKFRKSENAIETIVMGDQVKKFGLTLYHNLRVTDKASINYLKQLVNKDGESAINKEVYLYKGNLNYGLFEFKPLKGKNKRFIFFYSNDKMAMLIYMEGDTTLEDIKRIIEK
ncbi:MAG: hypothetical protein K2J74_03630 [Muribaculaceae bacterium]|nr:hypothetical protein [Muribaculaceae bacterium]